MQYITRTGDTFDSIAHYILGDRKYIKELMEANTAHIETIIFSSGTVINIPETTDNAEPLINMPPWRLNG